MVPERGPILQKADLPSTVQTCLDEFVTAAQSAFGSDLLSVTLFGSAAEGRLRPTSDVNLILVLKAFGQEAAAKITDALRVAHAAILLEVMFILESEIDSVAEAFAVKFADIESRHQVLFGKDYFDQSPASPEALRFRLRQVLTNQILRLRESYVLNLPQEEQLISIIANSAGPLRAAAHGLLKLNGEFAADPKMALQIVARRDKTRSWDDVLAAMTQARENRLAPGKASGVCFSIIALAEFMLTELTRYRRSDESL